jgi:hypothetical protein
VFQAFRELGVSHDQTLKGASALSSRDADAVSLKTELAYIKWMVSLLIILQIAGVGGIFAVWGKLVDWGAKWLG